MNKSEKATAQKIARIMRAARKQTGLSQIELSARLGVSQSNLSKYEAGLLIPSAHHWVELCGILRIPVRSYLHGYIDHQHPVQVRDVAELGNYALPKRYFHDCGSTVRTALPLVNYFQETLGHKQFQSYLKSIRLDADYLTSLDNPINLNFSLDLSKTLISKQVLSNSDLRKVVKIVAEPTLHGKLHENLDQTDKTEELFSTLFQNVSFYERNANYQILDKNSKHMTIAVTHGEHLQEFDFSEPDLGDFLCQYRKRWFKSFAGYGSHKGAELVDHDCMFKGSARCVYGLSFVR